MKKFAVAMLMVMTGVTNAALLDLTPWQSAGSIVIPGPDTVFFSPDPADVILYGTNADWNPQNPAHIQTVLEAELGVALTLVSESSLPDWGTSGTLDSDGNIYYMHFGDNGLAFGYAGPRPDAFSFSNLPHDISNYRIYGCADPQDCGVLTNRSIPNPVPIPAAAWMFGSGLIGLGAVARKRKLAFIK